MLVFYPFDMAQIVPAILENSKEGFLRTYQTVVKLPGVRRIQVDFGDGVFVPNKILPVDEIDSLNPAFEWEAHLMIKEPADFLDYQICGFKTIIVHYEAFVDGEALRNILRNIKSLKLKAGLAINPGTSISILPDFKDEADQFLIMSVNPGFQGQAFIEESVDRIKELRSLIPNAIIEVDGGINLDNIKKVARAGADLICVGSALTKSGNMAEAWEKLKQTISQAF